MANPIRIFLLFLPLVLVSAFADETQDAVAEKPASANADLVDKHLEAAGDLKDEHELAKAAGEEEAKAAESKEKSADVHLKDAERLKAEAADALANAMTDDSAAAKYKQLMAQAEAAEKTAHELMAKSKQHKAESILYHEQANNAYQGYQSAMNNANSLRSAGTVTEINNVTQTSVSSSSPASSSTASTSSAVSAAPAASAAPASSAPTFAPIAAAPAAAPAAPARAAAAETPVQQPQAAAPQATASDTSSRSKYDSAEIVKLLETVLSEKSSSAGSSSSTPSTVQGPSESKASSAEKPANSTQVNPTVVAYNGSAQSTAASSTPTKTPSPASGSNAAGGSTIGASANSAVGTSLYAAAPAPTKDGGDEKSKTIAQMLAEARAERGVASASAGRGVSGGGDTGTLIQSSISHGVAPEAEGDIDMAGLMAAAGIPEEGEGAAMGVGGVLGGSARGMAASRRGPNRLINSNAPVMPAALSAVIKQNRAIAGSKRPQASLAKN